MKVFCTTVLAFLFLTSSALANQSTVTVAGKNDKVPAYVILNTGKKITGNLKVGSITDNEVKVIFYSNSGSKTIYKPTDLKGYGYESIEMDDLGDEVLEWVHYETLKVDYPPKPFGPTTVFIQREMEGTVSLYCYYIESRADVKNPYRYFYYIKDQNGQMKKVEKEDFTDVSREVFGTYSAMTGSIGKKGFTYRNLDRMVRDYNYWTVNRHDADEYLVAMKN